MVRKSHLRFFFLVFAVLVGTVIYFYNDKEKMKHKLIFAIDIVRHGDRAPVDFVPKLSDYWVGHGVGTLTSLGAAQSEELGLAFRKYYIEQTRLLPSRYNKNDIVVRATDYQRTEASAQSMMRGMYPQDHSDIQVTVYPKEQDALLLQFYATQHKMREKNLFYGTSENVQNQARELTLKVREAIGENLDKPSDILHVADVLRANKVHKASLPVGLSEKDADDIIAVAQTLILNRFTAPEVECTSSNLLTNVQDLIQRFSINRDGPRYILYVAHDSNLLSLLGLLSYKLEELPPYNSYLRFELLTGAGEDLFVRVSYNKTPINICGEEICTAKQFRRLILEALQKKCASYDNSAPYAEDVGDNANRN